MKAKILLLIIFSGLILGCCRSKYKMTNVSKESGQETEKIKIDSLGLHSSESAQDASADISFKETKNEISGDMTVKGKSDISNPFVFHNIIGNDTIQSISIMGNAEYSISNHYTKADNKKSEVVKQESTNIVRDIAQHTVSRETKREKTSAVSEESKKIKSNGFQAGTWIVIAIVVTFLIFIFFAYKYFRK